MHTYSSKCITLATGRIVPIPSVPYSSCGMSIYVHTLDIMSIYGRRCVSFEKEWIENRDIKEELQEDLDELYGGTVWFIFL